MRRPAGQRSNISRGTESANTMRWKMRLEHFVAAKRPSPIPEPSSETMSRFIERRWGAVLAADVVEYSRLTSLNEERTYFRYKHHRRDLVVAKIAAGSARFVKSTG